MIFFVGYAVSNIRNVVSLIGATQKAGDYEWKQDLQLNDLITHRLDFSLILISIMVLSFGNLTMERDIVFPLSLQRY